MDCSAPCWNRKVFVTRLIPTLGVDNVDVPADFLLAGLKGERLPNNINPEVFSK